MSGGAIEQSGFAPTWPEEILKFEHSSTAAQEIEALLKLADNVAFPRMTELAKDLVRQLERARADATGYGALCSQVNAALGDQLDTNIGTIASVRKLVKAAAAGPSR